MTLDEFREELQAWWAETDGLEMARKNSQGALARFMDLYQQWSSQERELADQVIAEWVASENERKRFDALAMVDHFRIRGAGAQLRAAAGEIAKRKDHEAPYELAKLRRILERLEA